MERLRLLKDMMVSLWQVTRRRMRAGPARPSWSWLFEVLVEMLRSISIRVTPLTPQAQRAAWAALEMRSPLELRVTRERLELAGLPAEQFMARQRRSLLCPVVLYFHGGAYLYGSTGTHREMLCRLVLESDARVVGLNYRLAPEHPFPAAFEDAVAAYRALLDSGVAPSGLVLAGDSAGGGLVAATLIAARDAGLPLPAAAALICPWVDLAARGGSLASNERSDWGLQVAFDAWARTYLAGASPEDPRASPLHADLRGLPPLLVQVGEAEMLHDQVVAFAARTQAAGVETFLRVWPDMVHDWHFLAMAHEAGRNALAEIGAFVRVRTGAPAPPVLKLKA